MTNKKTSRRALLTSVMALVLCMVMLVGTTFAWFTDSVTSGVNTIQSGNLDVELWYSKDLTTWEQVTSTTKLFTENALWEPGFTDIVYLKAVNAGSLALKYSVGVAHNYYQSSGTNVEGKRFFLGDYLKVGGVETETVFANREAAQAAIAGVERDFNEGFYLNDGETKVLEPGQESKPLAMVIYMPTTVGNEANHKTGTRAPAIAWVGVELYATQAEVESDSFDSTYDKDSATNLNRVEYLSGTHEVTGNFQVSSKWGVVNVAGGTTTVNANINAQYEPTEKIAIAVWATGNWNGSSHGTVLITGGNYVNSGTPDDDNQFELIYADKGAAVEITGGTFKSVTPQWTLNCKDGSGSTITVKGGSFYQFDPSNANVGEGEIIVPEGYTVVQNGDWYTVVEE